MLSQKTLYPELFTNVLTFPFTPEGLVYRALGRATRSVLRTTTRTAPTTTTRIVPTTTTRTVSKKTTGPTSNQPIRRSPRIAEKRKFVGAEQAGSGTSKKYRCGLKTHPSTPVGRKGQRFHVLDKANVPTIINGRAYTGHAFDRMQERGFTPTMVENVIKNGMQKKEKCGDILYLDVVNNIKVVVTDSQKIRTVSFFKKVR